MELVISKLTENDWKEIERLAVEENKSNRYLADMYGVNESSIRRGLPLRGVKRFLVPEDQTFVERFQVDLDKPYELPAQDVAITADWHIPLYDPAYANKFIKEARARGHKTLVVAGDFFNFDALSAYDPKQDSANLEFELQEATSVMKALLETFDTIYYLWGNHDARLHRALGFSIKFREAMKMVFGNLGDEALAKIKFTNLDHMIVGDWYVCHPANYTRIPLSTARTLAAKYTLNVITAHSHHCAVGYATDGIRVVAEIGGLFDRHKTGYLQRSTTFPTWAQGYAFLEDGKLIVRSPGWDVQ